MGLLDGDSNRMLSAADYAGVQPGYAPAGPTNAGPLYDAAKTFWDALKAAPGAYLQQHQDFMSGLDPNTGQPAVSGYDRLNTLAHYFTSNMGPQSVGGLLGGPLDSALGAGAVRPYASAPDSLMGFRKTGPNVGFESSNYPHTQYVNVTLPSGDTFTDAIKGMNQSHALERARRNWDGATVEPTAAPDAGGGMTLGAGPMIPGMDRLAALASDNAAAARGEYAAGSPAQSFSSIAQNAQPIPLVAILRKFGLLGGALGGGLLGGAQQ